MIRGVHTMFYSSEPEAFRAFVRDKLGFPATDVGGGWLIFDLPEADMGCHPVEKGEVAGPPSGTADISFYCDDIEKTVAELSARGVEFTGPVEDRGYGLVTFFRVPGGFNGPALPAAISQVSLARGDDPWMRNVSGRSSSRPGGPWVARPGPAGSSRRASSRRTVRTGWPSRSRSSYRP